MPNPKRIHLAFKTHLDIGFTEHAETVRRLYHERFIPQAIATGAHFYAEDPAAPKFIWTTGAWLILDFLQTQPRDVARRLEDAIEKGLIRWHGLPFTMHSELMSPALFRAGLSYAAELDTRFGMTTIAAKMTDVPGHTRGIVPLMAQAGLKFLHIGVNSASPPPDVPDVFRWRAPDGEEIVVMYQRSYGETHVPDGLDTGLSFAHTNDNMGPQPIHKTIEVYRELWNAFPGTEIRAATLEDFGALLWQERARFPVIETELGDSWIHGAATDPIKMARFRALQRLYDTFETENLTPSRKSFGRILAMVAEHTWGVDIKTFLRDDIAWDRPDFETARQTDYRFAYTEASWAEQRSYLESAVSTLVPEDRTRATAALEQTEVQPAPAPPEAVQTEAKVGEWSITLDPDTGDVTSLAAPSGTTLAGSNGSLLGYRHESYDAAELAVHLESYLTDRPEWALLDHDKPGLSEAKTARTACFAPRLLGAHRVEDALIVLTELPDDAHQALGAPRHAEYRLMPTAAGLDVTVVLRGKPTNRMPEAGFVHFTPNGARDWELEKTGLWQRADAVAVRGGGALQAIFGARAQSGPETLSIVPHDTALVGPADHRFMQFPVSAPSYAAGLRFNLYNNKWGTNFPMWWEGDFAARFTLALT